MTIARSKQVDPDLTRWYHCISSCVRRAHLLQGSDVNGKDRKIWIQDRLKELNSIFAISVGGFAILDNHFHLLLRLDPQDAAGWSDEEIVERWFILYPPRGPDRRPLTGDALLELRRERLSNPCWLNEIRGRLCSLSWFMKCLKEPLARMINRTDQCRGTLFEGRFKSIAVLDEQALLTVCAYIDLNPIAAGIAATPEASFNTSVKTRIDHARNQGRTHDVAAAANGSIAGSDAARHLEEALWLIPIEDRRRLDSEREGMLESFTLGNYLMLVEYTGRLFRDGKARITANTGDIFQRLQVSSLKWHGEMRRLRGERLTGRFIATSAQKLQAASKQFGLSRIVNLRGASLG